MGSGHPQRLSVSHVYSPDWFSDRCRCSTPALEGVLSLPPIRWAQTSTGELGVAVTGALNIILFLWVCVFVHFQTIKNVLQLCDTSVGTSGVTSYIFRNRNIKKTKNSFSN